MRHCPLVICSVRADPAEEKSEQPGSHMCSKIGRLMAASVEGHMICPCYCVLPYITKSEAKESCKRTITASMYYIPLHLRTVPVPTNVTISQWGGKRRGNMKRFNLV